MKKIIIKVVSICLCMLLPAGVLGATVYASIASGDNMDSTIAATSTDAEAEMENEEVKTEKDETVYVLADAYGSVQKIIVSDWLKNNLGSSAISDKTQLSDVYNTKGDEQSTLTGGDSRVWDAQGNDIYYQGNIDKELPVDMKITYLFNGSPATAEEIAGKSGKVTIRFDYVNKQYETVEIDGKTERIYVPFVTLTGMLLDNDVFSNIEVSNGKMINDGTRIAVIGIAFPGLQSNLNISSKELTIPEYFEISADVKDFKFGTTLTLATNEIFNKIDVTRLDDISSAKDSISVLKDAMSQLMDGSSKLYDGLCTLLDKSDSLISGINQLADGSEKLQQGTYALDEGAEKLKNGANELSEGLDTLAGNNDKLTGGAKQVFNSLLSMATEQLTAAGLTVPKLTIDNYSESLNKIMKSIDEKSVYTLAYNTALKKVTDTVNSQKSVIRSKVTDAVEAEVTKSVESAVRQQVEVEVLKALGMTKSTYEASIAAGLISKEQQKQISDTVDYQMTTDDIKNTIKTQTQNQMKTKNIQATIDSKTDEQIKLLIEQNMNSKDVQNQITAALKKAKSGAASISALKAQLDSYKEFYDGINEYTAGVSAAASGAKELKNGTDSLAHGTSELSSGAITLHEGIMTLKKGTSSLTSGVTQLRDGAMQLSDGLKALNENGIQKLTDLADENLDTLVARVRATVNASKNYKSFAGIADDTDGKVKFIYRTDSIK